MKTKRIGTWALGWIAVLGGAVGTGGADAAGGASATGGKISDLAFMAGSWCGEKDGVASEEHWTTPEGGAMVGMHKDVQGGKMTSFEFARVAVEGDGRVCYLASPGGAPPTPFCAVELSARRVVFENREHDFPQRVIYWKTDGKLNARIEGKMDGREMSDEWSWSACK